MIINILTIFVATGLVWGFQGTSFEFLIDVVSKGSVILGLLFFLGTSVGVLRFPDFYSRLHAAGKGDTLSSAVILFGCAIYVLDHGHLSISSIFVGIKLLIIMNFIFIGSPTATHAIMDAGYETEIKHWSKREASEKSGDQV